MPVKFPARRQNSVCRPFNSNVEGRDRQSIVRRIIKGPLKRLLARIDGTFAVGRETRVSSTILRKSLLRLSSAQVLPEATRLRRSVPFLLSMMREETSAPTCDTRGTSIHYTFRRAKGANPLSTARRKSQRERDFLRIQARSERTHAAFGRFKGA